MKRRSSVETTVKLSRKGQSTIRHRFLMSLDGNIYMSAFIKINFNTMLFAYYKRLKFIRVLISSILFHDNIPDKKLSSRFKISPLFHAICMIMVFDVCIRECAVEYFLVKTRLDDVFCEVLISSFVSFLICSLIY